jgi:tRNA G26 N,N-dimethylase Trm1
MTNTEKILKIIDNEYAKSKWHEDNKRLAREIAVLLDKRDEIIELLEKIISTQAAYGKIGDVMKLRQKINELKKEIGG